MEYLTLQHSDLHVSRLCMGGCPMGGYGWGAVEEKDLLDAVDAALEAGINFFDTADTYGLGQSETTLGKALKGKRNQAVIATKFGVRYEDGKSFYDNSPEWIEMALDNSLKRLGVDTIDLYQVHYRDEQTPIEIVVETLERMKEKGKIRFYGLSNIHHKDLAELRSYSGRFISFQDEYSLATRKNESDILALSYELQLSPLTWGSLGQGILTGKYDETSTFGKDDRRSREIYVNFHGEKLKRNLAIVQVMKEIAQEINQPVPAIAIRFILDYLPQSVVLAGVKNQNQLQTNAEAFGWRLTQEQVGQLHQVSEKSLQA